MTHSVGHVFMNLFLSVKGQGGSWAEAFAEADRKRQAERQRFIDDWTRIHGEPPPPEKLNGGEW